MDPLAAAIQMEVTDEGIEVRHAEPQEDTSLTELLPLQGLLGLEEAGPRQRTQMKEVWDYFSQDSQGVGDALYKVKQTEMKMTAPKLGETRLTKLYNYVKLQNQQHDIEQQLEAL